METLVMRALLVCLVLMLAMDRISDAAWCMCRTDISDTALQKTLDYACGAGADCVPINQNGACYNPNTVNAHCSYAANSYFQRKGQAPQTCDFSGTATLIQQDPSSNGCTYPTSPSAAGASSGNSNGTGAGTGAGTGVGAGLGSGGSPPPPTTGYPGSATPSIMTPTNPGTGGVIGSSGNTFSTDNSNDGCIPMPHTCLLLLLILSVLSMLRD